MHLCSLKLIFEKIQRYQNRRMSLSLPEFTSKTVYTLTDAQVLEFDTKGLTPEEYLFSHIGNRNAVIFDSVVTQDEPMTLEEISDLAEDLVKTIWDGKDRIKIIADKNGIISALFWDETKSNFELTIVADLANTIKHG